MPPALALDPWWTAHLQLPGYDPIATAGTWHGDLRAAEQAQVFVTQALDRALSPWQQAIVCNLWGWRQADGQRRYATVYAEPYRPEALALWSVALGLWLLLAAPPRRPHLPHARAAQDDRLSLPERLPDGGQERLDGCFCLDVGATKGLSDPSDDLLFPHAATILVTHK